MSSDISPDAGAAPVVLDRQALARLEQLDPLGRQGLLRRVMATYRGSLERIAAQIAAGLADSDHASIRLGAHTLKSSSASVGATELSALCATLEELARDARVGELPGLVARVQSEITRVDQAVTRLMAD